MEYRVLYDEYGNKTDEVVEKGYSYPENRRIMVAAIIIENDENKYLIQKRSMNKGDIWAFTSGHIESFETSLEGIVREAKEELGLDIDSKNIITFNSGVNKKYVFYSYYLRKNIDLNSLVLQSDEVEDAKLVSLSEIENLINKGNFKESHIKIFNDYINFKNCENNS